MPTLVAATIFAAVFPATSVTPLALASVDPPRNACRDCSASAKYLGFGVSEGSVFVARRRAAIRRVRAGVTSVLGSDGKVAPELLAHRPGLRGPVDHARRGRLR